MGGLPSLGYDVKDRKLIIMKRSPRPSAIFFTLPRARVGANPADELDAAGIVSKRRIAADGSQYGAQRFSRGAL